MQRKNSSEIMSWEKGGGDPDVKPFHVATSTGQRVRQLKLNAGILWSSLHGCSGGRD